MSTFGISAYIIKSHIVFGSATLSLKEDGLLVTAQRARVLFSSRKCRVVNHVGYDSGQFTVKTRLYIRTMMCGLMGHSLDFVGYFVDINTVIVGDLFVITVSALKTDFDLRTFNRQKMSDRIKQNPGLLVFARVQHVVAVGLRIGQ